METRTRDVSPIRVYVEDLAHRMPRKFLSDAVYAEAIAGFVIVCTDAVVVDRARQTFWLARRCVKPQSNWWVIGGRMMAGEGVSESVRRCFKRETGLDIPAERFEPFGWLNRYLWKDRQQEPQNIGSDNLCFTFSVELSPEERAMASASLERDEYEPGGLIEFNRARLFSDPDIHPMLRELFTELFGEK